MELTDIHKRRANIDYVSKRCKEHSYPLLIWPEDLQLLRLSDLPTFTQPNKPVDWETMKPNGAWIVVGDTDLRAITRVGRAYSISISFEKFVEVQEWIVKSR